MHVCVCSSLFQEYVFLYTSLLLRFRWLIQVWNAWMPGAV